MSSKGRPWRTRTVDGFDVLMGRDAAGNAALTRTLQPGDVWLHVSGGHPGSHVVVRGGVDAEPGTIDRAARWAAWHSSCRRHADVAVMICERSQVLSVDDDGTAHVEWPVVEVRVPPENPNAEHEMPGGRL